MSCQRDQLKYYYSQKLLYIYFFFQEEEDCLYMNIYVPKGIDLSNANVVPSAQLPVVVWFHGGSFWFGSGLAPLYDGRYMAEAINAIVITMNYRLRKT